MISRKLFSNFATTSICVGVGVLITLACTEQIFGLQLQQPSPHLKFERNQFQPIPTKANDANSSAVKKPLSERIMIDKLVQKTAFEQPATDRFTSKELLWSRKLEHLSFKEFFSRLDRIWGKHVEFSFLDNSEQMLRIYMPEGISAPASSMKCDCVNGVLTYEGTADRKKSWHKLMNFIDRADSGINNKSVSLIDVGMVDDSFVKLVSQEFQDQDQDPAPTQIEITRENLSQLAQIEDLQGRIELTPIPDQGIIIVRGDPEAVAQIQAFLNRLNNRAVDMGNKARSYRLLYNDPANVVDSIQSLYDAQFASLNGDVSIIPTPSGVLAAGSEGALNAIQQIVDGLEGVGRKPETGDPKELSEREKGYRRYVLANINVADANQAVLSLAGQSQNLNTAQQSRQAQAVDTTIQTLANALIVFASPEFLVRADALIKEIDVPKEPNQKARVWRIFPVKNHRAGDFAVLLQDTLTQGFQTNQGLNETQNQQLQGNQNNIQQQFQNNNNTTQPFLGFSTLRIQLNGVPSRPINFFDVRITSDAPSNTLQVVATEEAMPMIEQIIEQLDRLPDLNSEVKVFPIINGDAQEILDTLEQIFGAQAGGGAGAAAQTGSLADLPLQSPGSDGASLISIRFAINQRTNTIIASGSEGDLQFVEALIYRLDEEDIQDRQMNVYRLSNTSVGDVSNAINNVLTEREALFGTDPRTANGTNFARRDVIVVAEETSNSLIVNARPEQMAVIDHLVNALDRRPPMVKVKAMIVQVDLNQLEDYGVDFGIQDSSIFDAGLSDGIGNGFVGLDNPAGQLISDLGAGRVSSTAGLSGLLLSAGDESLNFLIRFLKQKGCASVLFAPQLMTVENLEGRFNQGASIQRATGFNQGIGGFATQNFTDVTVGITLAITPRVSPDGMIVMFVDVANSALGPIADGTPVGVDGAGNPVISPPINQTLAQTTVMARSGQTVALSGLIQESKGQSINSVPFLGDLPVVGPLFQSVENTADRQEILIILTPYVVDGEDDLSALNEDDFSRMHWCKDDIAEAYGDTSYTGLPYRESYPKVFYPDQDPRGESPEFKGEDTLQDFSQDNGFNDPEPAFRDEQWRGRDAGSGNRNPAAAPQGSSMRNPLPPQSNQGYSQGYREPVGRNEQQPMRGYDQPYIQYQGDVGRPNSRQNFPARQEQRYARGGNNNSGNLNYSQYPPQTQRNFSDRADSPSPSRDRRMQPLDLGDLNQRAPVDSGPRLELNHNGAKYSLR